MDKTDAFLVEAGYIPQRTPAGRVIMVNPAAYPLSDEFLANEDDYADETYQDYLDEEMESYADYLASMEG